MLRLTYISENVNNIVYTCRICHVNVNNKDSAGQCDICQSWVHIKCNKRNLTDYKYLQGSNEPWYCLSASDLALLYNQFNNTSSPEKKNDPVNVVNSNTKTLTKSKL